MKARRFVQTLLALLLALSLLPIPSGLAERMPYAIGVDLTNQIVTVYDTSTGDIVRQMICSSGAKRTPTITGTFVMPTNRNRMERKEWYDFNMITYVTYAHYATRIHEGYMFHSYLFRSKYGNQVSAKTVAILGAPDSHGCMRMYPEDAEWIAKNCLAGTKVKIYKSGRVDTYLRRILKTHSFTADAGVSYAEFVGGATNDGELGYGSTGDAVRKLQSRMLGLGLYMGEVTGVYDADMMRSVAVLQEALGLEINGKMNKGLWELIFSPDAPTSDLASASLGASGPLVAYVQALLKKAALYSGEITGEFDADTDVAVRRLQNYLGFEANGVLTSDQRAALIDLIDDLTIRFPDGYSLKSWNKPIPMASIETRIRLNVRETTSKDARSMGKLEPKTVVQVLEKDGDWTKIAYGDISGYVLTEYIEEFNEYEPVVGYVDDPDPALVSFDEKAWAMEPLLGSVDIPVGTGNAQDRVVFYKDRNTDSGVAFGIVDQEWIDLEASEGNWVQATYCGVTGYAPLKELTISTRRELSTAVPGEERAGLALNVSGEAVNVYDNVSVNSNVIGTLDSGAEAEVTLKGDTWSQISFGDGVGYVENEDLQIGSISLTLRAYRESVIQYLSQTGSIEGATAVGDNHNLVQAIAAEEAIPEVNLNAEIIDSDLDDEEYYAAWEGVNDDFTAPPPEPVIVEPDPEPDVPANLTHEPEVDTSAARAAFDAADAAEDGDTAEGDTEAEEAGE